jgi:hypothetical protein
MKRISCSFQALALAFLIMASASLPGCSKSDVTLIRTSPYGNSEDTVGSMFEHYGLFLSRSWAPSVDAKGRHLVVFTARIPADKLLKQVSADSSKWLSVEKRYSAAVVPHVRAAYVMITFVITSPATFELGNVRLGLSSASKTAWSDDLRMGEKEGIMIAVYRNSPDILPILARYANPSVREGSDLYARLTGKSIDTF